VKLQNIKKKVYKYKGVQKVSINFDVVYENEHDAYTAKELQDVINEQDWLLEHYIKWRNWDEHYTIKLFRDSLYHLGKRVYDGHFVGSEKQGARALLAVDMLDKLYLNIPNDKSMDNHMKRFTLKSKPFRSTTLGLVHRVYHEYSYANAMGLPKEEYESKMFKVIHDRQEKAAKKNKAALWAFIGEYIEYWWN
jgi:hypothetical protein